MMAIGESHKKIATEMMNIMTTKEIATVTKKNITVTSTASSMTRLISEFKAAHLKIQEVEDRTADTEDEI